MLSSSRMRWTASRPCIPSAAIAAEIRSKIAGDPETAGLFEAALQSAQVFLSGRERAKTNVVTVINEMRVALREFAPSATSPLTLAADLAAEVPVDQRHGLVQRLLADIGDEHVIARQRADMGDAVAHHPDADDPDSFDSAVTHAASLISVSLGILRHPRPTTDWRLKIEDRVADP